MPELVTEYQMPQRYRRLKKDKQQLSPVVTESERPFMEKVYPSPFFFHSKALGRISYMTIELTEVYRQADSRFIGILNAVRDQNLTPEQSAVKAIRADIMPLWRMHKATLEEVAANGFNLARYQEVQTLALLGK